MKNRNDLLNVIGNLDIEMKKEIIDYLLILNNQYNSKPLESD